MNSALPPLDPDGFSILLELCDGNDFSAMKTIVDTFFEDLGPLMARMAAAEATFDYEVMRKAAHTLKGSSSTFGMAQVADAARELEMASAACEAVGMKRWVVTLRKVLPAGCDAVRAHMNALMNKEQ